MQDDEISMMALEYMRGIPQERLAEKYGISLFTVRSTLMQALSREDYNNRSKKRRSIIEDYKNEIIEMFVDGKSAEDIAASYKVSAATVRIFLKRNLGEARYREVVQNNRRSPRTDYVPIHKMTERNKGIIQMRMQGSNMQDIARKYNISRQRVHQILYESGYAKLDVAKVRSKKLYDYIVQYKMDHDGNSPLIRTILMDTGDGLSRVRGQLSRLRASGAIRFRDGRIEVVGGQWTPPESDGDNPVMHPQRLREDESRQS